MRIVRPVGLAALLLVAVLVRLHSESALWLDEALTVHIARLPLADLPAALRADGAPPVFYVLLHGWMGVFGQSPNAVRLLPGLFSLAALPVIFSVARRQAGPRVAVLAVLLLATNPFAVRYASETRMYSLVVLEVAVGARAVQWAWGRTGWARLWPLPLLSALLVLTHYWSLFLLTVVAVVLLVVSRRDRRALAVLGALAAGGLLVLPWLPILLFQVTHTGAPWAPGPNVVAALDTVMAWAGGGTGAGKLLTLLLLAVAVVAVLGRVAPGGLLLGQPRPLPSALLGVTAGTLLLGVGTSAVLGSAYTSRYSSVAVVPMLLLVAIGLATLPGRTATAVTGLVVALGLAGAVTVPFDAHKTQAGQLATAMRAGLSPGDLVVYCPDQLGPALSTLLPPDVHQVVYPTLAGPDRIDWVDYASRNGAADPALVTEQVLQRAAGHPVWLVWQPGYRTFGTACQRVQALLAADRGPSIRLVTTSARFYERASLDRFPAR